MTKPKQVSPKREEIRLKYAKLAQKLDRYPSRADLKKDGISRDMVRDHFGDMEGLRSEATDEHAQHFEDILTMEYFSPDLYRDQLDVVATFKTHVITTAVAGAPVHEEFLASLLNYCDVHKAALWVIPADYALQDIDKSLIRDPRVNIVFRQIRLNKKCVIDPIRIDPKQVEPLQGLEAFAHDEGTVIIGSPKQRRLPLANAQGKIPPVMQATGAVTRPRYNNGGDYRRRNSMAHKHHVMGAVVVEIQDDKIHYPRNIVMSRDGSFNDLFNNYASDEVKPAAVSVIKPGDWHVGVTDPTIRKTIIDVCKKAKPDYLILEDFADFSSINPHEEDMKVIRAQLGLEGLSLDNEMQMNVKELEALRSMKLVKKAIVITASNHIDFLPRYLNKGKFDDMNRKVATKLQLIAMEKKDPYEFGLKELYGLKPGKDVIFLPLNGEFRISGVEQGAHGHRGANGKRNPGAKGMFKAYGKVSYGHCHHGEIWHGAMSSGTSTYMDLGYNPGQSSWDHSFQIQHADGTRQLVNIIKGKYTLQG